MRSGWLVLALLLPASAAASHSVGLEVGLARVEQPAPAESTTPPGSATYLITNVYGTVEAIEDRLDVDLMFSLLRDEGTSVAYQGTAGLRFMPNDHWSFGLSGTFMPRKASNYEATNPILFPTLKQTLQVPTTWSTVNAYGGATVSIGWDSFGETDFETAVDVSVGYARYLIFEDLTYPASWQPRVTAAGQSAEPHIEGAVDQLMASGNVTETLFHDTDLSLRFTYYNLLDKRPSSVGYGRAARTGGIAAPAGSGLPTAPLRWDLRPTIAERFTGWFAAALQAGVGGYYDNGSYLSVGLRLTFKPLSQLKLYVNATAQRDLEPPDTDGLWGFFLGLGSAWRF
jgi:hypothetical protein